jgi:hypothetical protein
MENLRGLTHANLLRKASNMARKEFPHLRNLTRYKQKRGAHLRTLKAMQYKQLHPKKNSPSPNTHGYPRLANEMNNAMEENIPVQQTKRTRKAPKRLINEIAPKPRAKKNLTKRFKMKAPKFVRTNNLGNPIKRAVKKQARKAPTNGNTNMMAAAAPVVRDDEDRNPFAVRLGAIKQKYVPQIEAKELQREQALAAHDYKTARILEKEINDLKEAKNKEQQTAREAVVAEKRQADALANLLGAKAVIGGPVPSAAAPAYAPTGFFMQPAATGWAQPTGGIGAPPPAPYFTAGPGFGQYPPPTGGIGAPPFYSTGGPGGLGGEGR